MEQLLKIDNGIEFFLMSASAHVNWEGRCTDILGDKLTAVAAEVNDQLGTNLNCFDIKLTWVQLRALWETWVRATHYVPVEAVDVATGQINISDYGWNQLVRVVPDAEVFQRKPMISANMVCSVFSRTPPSLAPEELHARGYMNMSPEEIEEEINNCMRKVCEIDELRTSPAYMEFCLSIFRNNEIRDLFCCLPTKSLRYKYIIKLCNEEDGL